MDSIITPAVIAAVISMAGLFCKDIWFDRKISERETRVLAIRISYILEKYMLKCAVQLTKTKLYIDTKQTDPQTGYDIPHEGIYNTEFLDLPLDMENVNWKNLDVNIISRLIDLSLYIMSCDTNVKCKHDFYGQDVADKEYIKRASTIVDKTLKIIKIIRDKYNVKNIDIYVYDELIDTPFNENIQ